MLPFYCGEVRMEATTIVLQIAAAFAGGAGVSALINALHDRWKVKKEIEVKKEDRAEEKADKTKELQEAIEEFKEKESAKTNELGERLKLVEEMNRAQTEAMKLLMLDRILHMGQKFIDRGEVSFEELSRFHAMHDCYHNRLNGNGDADFIVSAVNELRLKK